MKEGLVSIRREWGWDRREWAQGGMGRVGLETGNNLCCKERPALHSCPGQWGIPIPGVFSDHGDVALGDVGNGHGGMTWAGLGIPEVISNLSESVSSLLFMPSPCLCSP